MAESTAVPILSAALETSHVISSSSGLHDSTTITYDAAAPLGLVWVHLVQGSAGIVPVDGAYSGPGVPPPSSRNTVYTANTFVSNSNGPGYWYVITPGRTDPSGGGPTGTSRFQDGGVLWGYSVTAPSLLHIPIPINHVNGFEDLVVISDAVRRAKFIGGLVVLISTAKLTKATPGSAYAMFDVLAT